MEGRRNGNIVITSFRERRANKVLYWNYLCDCGKTGVISKAEFKRNRAKVKSCGCLKPHIDISNKRFGKLVAKEIHHKKDTKYMWLCVCDCGKTSIVEKHSLIMGRTTHCNTGCTYESEENYERKREIIRKRVKIDSNGCWIWQGPIRKLHGYGAFNCGKIDQQVHRASYKLFVGKIPEGKWVLHKCDVKVCCNPDHLYIGDVKQNVKDAIERGQFPRGPNLKKGHKGEKNTKAKLTESDVIKIREIYIPNVYGAHKIAKLYNVSKFAILQIVRRRTWKHI